MKKVIVFIIIVILALSILGATYSVSTVVNLKANQSITIRGHGCDEIIIDDYGNNEVDVTCRVWLEND